MPKYPLVELRYEDLEQEPFDRREATIYRILRDGVPYDMLIARDFSSDRALVFGNGQVLGDRKDWPIFSRQTWFDRIPANCVYYFDPTLYMGNVGLGWYYGTNDRWFLQEIAEMLPVILMKAGVLPENTLMTGSSGGGFSSIALATLLHTRCMAINPQTDFRRYWQRYVKALTPVSLKEGEDWIEERVNLLALMRRENYMPYTHIVQNLAVEFDLKQHIQPLLDGLCQLQADCGYRKLKLEFYYHPDGHSAMPPMDICINSFLRDLEEPFFDTALPATAADSPVKAEYRLTGSSLTVHLEGHLVFAKYCKFAYALYRNGQLLGKTGFSDSMDQVFPRLPSGRYTVEYFIRSRNEEQGYLMPELEIR